MVRALSLPVIGFAVMGLPVVNSPLAEMSSVFIAHTLQFS